MRIFLAILWFVSFSCVAHAQSVVVEPARYDFGVVKQGDHLSHVFFIRNAGATPLRINKVEASIAGVTTRFPADVRPGDAVPVTVQWNTTGFSGHVDAAAIIYASDLEQPPIELHLSATVKPAIEFDPFPAVFFTAYEDESPEKRVRIINHDEMPLELGRVEADESHYIVQMKTIRPGQEFELIVRVRPGIRLGRYTEPIYIATNVAARPRLQLQANLFVKADLYAFPEQIDFGTVRLSDLDANPRLTTLLSQTVVVTSRVRPLEILSIESDLPFLRFVYDEPEAPEHKSRVTIELVRERLEIGSGPGKVIVHTSDPLHPVIEIPLRAEIR